jgi:hypothetical protein
MSIQFTTTSQQSSSNGVKMLVYGGSGVGKTLLCATAPAPIILSAESGLLSLSPQNQKRILGTSVDIPVIPIKTYQDLEEAYTWLTTDPHAQHFQTICLDSLTEIGEAVLANEKNLYKDMRQAYGEMIEKTIRLVKLYRDLPKHVYMSAKMQKVKDEVTGAMLFGPAMPGAKLAEQLPYFFDEVFNLNVGKDNDGRQFRYLRTDPDLQYAAKDRSGALDVIEQPNLNNIINKINNV